MWNKVVNKIDQNISPTKEHVLQRGRGHDKKDRRTQTMLESNEQYGEK